MQPPTSKWQFIGLGIMFLAVSILIVTQRYQLRLAERTLADQIKGQDSKLEQIHSVGFDQGYVEATLDYYLGTPSYIMLHRNKDLTLWKKIPIDQETHKRLKQKNNHE
jgi:hypothetical protein